MTSGFRFKASHAELGSHEVAALRRVCHHSITEIRRRSQSEESLVEVVVFSGSWPAGQPALLALLRGIEGGTLPLRIYAFAPESGASDAEEKLTVDEARQRLSVLQAIALEQDRLAQLEQGIKVPKARK